VNDVVVLDDVWRSHRRRSRRGGLRLGQLRWALRGVTVRVAPGDAVGIIGGNGSGKTTMLRVVAGIVEPSCGRVVVHGRVQSLIDLTPGIDRDLTGLEGLRLRAILGGLRRSEVAMLWERMIAFTGIDRDQLSEPLHSYSAGMMLRVAAAAALVPDADVVALDEVLAVGDAEFQRRCLDRIAELVGGGAAALIVSHDPSLIAKHTDRAIALDHGEVVAAGTPHDVLTALEARGTVPLSP
jgi:lipopolysaccharide transport system ATP-binding protein